MSPPDNEAKTDTSPSSGGGRDNNSNNNNNNGSTTDAVPPPALSYMEEMRLAKFARSHRNLAPYIQGPIGGGRGGTHRHVNENKNSNQQQQQQENNTNSSSRSRRLLVTVEEADDEVEEESDDVGGEDGGGEGEGIEAGRWRGSITTNNDLSSIRFENIGGTQQTYDDEVWGGLGLSQDSFVDGNEDSFIGSNGMSAGSMSHGSRRGLQRSDDRMGLQHVLQQISEQDERDRRRTGMVNAKVWKSFVQNIEQLDEDLANTDDGGDAAAVDDAGGGGHHGGAHHHHLRLPFYSYPRQRQRWGEPTQLPHINWGDLFFDLFYVAAAYNLGNVLISVLTPDQWQRGIIYFLGIFGALYGAWERKMNYDARYLVVDYAHRIFEVIRVFLVGLAVLHIKPVEFLSDSSSAETFTFVLCIFLESLTHILLEVELILVGIGDRTALVNHSKRKLKASLIPLSCFYLAATIISGVSYFRSDDGEAGTYDSSSPYPTKDYDSKNTSNYGSEYGSGNSTESDHEYPKMLRYLAASSDSEYNKYEDAYTTGTQWSISDLPLSLCFIGYILNLLFTAFRKIYTLDSKKRDVRDHYIPNNIDFMIHRYGEFTMLMLGEIVLSVLIVDTVESRQYYAIACSGLLSVITIQALKFESEPSHADAHCLWRGIKSGLLFNYLVQLLSISLIAFGVSYKVMLNKVHTVESEEEYGGYGYDENEERRRVLIEELLELSSVPSSSSMMSTTSSLGQISMNFLHRMLAAVPVVSNGAIGALFCASLTIVLGTIDLMEISHKGFKAKFFYKSASKWHFRKRPCLVLLLNVMVLVFVATLPQWTSNLNVFTWLGFGACLVSACISIIDWKIDNQHDDMKRLVHAINKANKINVAALSKHVASVAKSTTSAMSSIRTGNRVSSTTENGSEPRKLSSSVAEHRNNRSETEPETAPSIFTGHS